MKKVCQNKNAKKQRLTVKSQPGRLRYDPHTEARPNTDNIQKPGKKSYNQTAAQDHGSNLRPPMTSDQLYDHVSTPQCLRLAPALNWPRVDTSNCVCGNCKGQLHTHVPVCSCTRVLMYSCTCELLVKCWWRGRVSDIFVFKTELFRRNGDWALWRFLHGYIKQEQSGALWKLELFIISQCQLWLTALINYGRWRVLICWAAFQVGEGSDEREKRVTRGGGGGGRGRRDEGGNWSLAV